MTTRNRAEAERFASWARERTPALARFAIVLTGDARRAEDRLGRALSRAWAAWPGFRSGDDPEMFVRRVMLHAYTTKWPPGTRDASTAPLSLPDSADAVQIALQEMSPRQRALVFSRYCEERDDSYTANLLGCSLGTVQSQAGKALAKLRGSLPELRDAYTRMPDVVSDPEQLIAQALNHGQLRRRDELRRRAVAFVVVCAVALMGMTGMSRLGGHRTFRGALAPPVPSGQPQLSRNLTGR